MKGFILSIVFLFVLLASSSTLAQGVISHSTNESYITQKKIAQPSKGSAYTGSPYADKAFQKGNVYRDGVLLASNVALRYNVLRDEFEIKRTLSTSNYDAKVLRKSKDIYVKIFNKLYVYFDNLPNNKKGGYFEVVYAGEGLSLYKKTRKEFIEGKKAINSIAVDILPQYREKEALFLLNSDNELIKLPKSRSGKISNLNQHKKEVKQFIRDEKLNVNKVYDLIKLLTYYNSLGKS